MDTDRRATDRGDTNHGDQSQAIRDLRWAIESPSLIVGGAADGIVLDPRQLDATELERFVALKRSSRVGLYFEQLILFWLTRIRRLESVRHGVQVQREGRTVGEVDFLFRDEQERWTHMETAVKFYLHLPDAAGESCYIGPNARDHFEKKLRRLTDHQLPLSQTAFPEVSCRIPLVKGRIFYHPGETPNDHDAPKGLAADHLRGTWIRAGELSWLDSIDRDSRYRVVRKPHWLSAEIVSIDSIDLFSLAGLKEAIRMPLSKGQPVLIAVLERKGSLAVETDRMFIVPDSWPSVRPG